MSSKSSKHPPVAAYQSKDQGKQRRFIIPTISYDQVKDMEAYRRVQRACGAVSHVVVVSSAGISTNAGIPDFRSADGLYNKALPGFSELLGPEMFDARVLQDREKLLHYGRAMGALRVASKRTSPTACHNYIAKLHEHGRLLHCYTQNVDGLQTSSHPQLAGRVLELHGNIHHIQCNRCGQPPDENPDVIDQLFLKDGYVKCKKCGKRGDTYFLPSLSSLLTLPGGKSGAGSKWNLRPLPPGLLLPKVLHNEGSWEIELDGKFMDELEQTDSIASLLYILGTSIRTDGAAKLIRALAKRVHNNNGIVVYVDRQILKDRKLASYFDLQIESDLDVWAKDACQSFNNECVDLKAEILDVKRWLNSENSARLTSDQPMPTLCAAPLLAQSMAIALIGMGNHLGWVCHAHLVVLGNEELSETLAPLHGPRKPIEPGQSIQELLANSVQTMNQLCKKSNGATLLMLCAVDHLLEETTFERLQEAFDGALQFVLLHDTELGKLGH
ncbi:hypothetical protein BN14_07810 [Rhizoctonia solani AG-1 IB]|uniref:Deacetylase sirtuin-type domain-containing protein n=1 Tax=Thanatephorus cucumeris (strain AG1-IB / isolate 7/3/14) TaxID=1108050 RepID=M5C300_THACB|nr:hypothetical protein BN14_07810 [Rhizoctonia solani AG-1 IB]